LNPRILGLNERISGWSGCYILIVIMAEWLRRKTRNLMGFPRAGSNPADDEFFLAFWGAGFMVRI
jgi:hypothetical protein